MSHYVLVTGGRDPEPLVCQEVVDCLAWMHMFYGSGLRVLHGDARGVDTVADDYCKEVAIVVKGFPADWDTHGKKAGFIRNTHMATLLLQWIAGGHTGEVLAFEGGRGTANMKTVAERVGLQLTTIPEGGVRSTWPT